VNRDFLSTEDIVREFNKGLICGEVWLGKTLGYDGVYSGECSCTWSCYPCGDGCFDPQFGYKCCDPECINDGTCVSEDGNCPEDCGMFEPINGGI
jgi:hypothetical protein